MSASRGSMAEVRLRSKRSAHRGFTLIEAVVALVILSAAAAGVLIVFAGPMTASADPQIRAQARALASGYMDEIVLRPFRDSEGNTNCDASERANFDTIWCYDRIDDESPPKNQFGTEIEFLADYTVNVDVGEDGGSATITVKVAHASGKVAYELVSNRGDY